MSNLYKWRLSSGELVQMTTRFTWGMKMGFTRDDGKTQYFAIDLCSAFALLPYPGDAPAVVVNLRRVADLIEETLK